VRVAVVGHIEWVDFVRVERLPVSGAIVHALDAWAEPGGGGAVAAVQLRKLAGSATFYTAIGNDALGRRSLAALTSMGVRVEAVRREEPQRRAICFVERSGERTITVIGDRIVPCAGDQLPWDELASCDAVYVTGADAAAIRAARASRVLVATPRTLTALSEAAVELDALVGSGRDPGERFGPGDLEPPPRVVVQTLGADGGSYALRGGRAGMFPAARLERPVADAYGCGDSFAAGLTFGLAAYDSIVAALDLAARCGAAALTGRGAYAGQLRLVD
jgi:ribokinase